MLAEITNDVPSNSHAGGKANRILEPLTKLRACALPASALLLRRHDATDCLEPLRMPPNGAIRDVGADR